MQAVAFRSVHEQPLLRVGTATIAYLPSLPLGFERPSTLIRYNQQWTQPIKEG